MLNRSRIALLPDDRSSSSEWSLPRATSAAPGGDGALRILQVSTYDANGGAEKVAWDLFRSYRARGLQSWLAVGTKRSDDPDVIPIPKLSCRSLWDRPWLSLERRLHPFHGAAYSLCRTLLRALAHPAEELGGRLGIEGFNHPSTYRLLELTSKKPDILHCHNLHGGYFDLRVLPQLSKRLPVVLTLHDAWLLSGHCSHSFECQRWKTGCGHCPDLTIYPAITRDATSYNWRRKRDIFAKSRLHVATPCRWLMGKVEQSILAPALEQARVIPYGIDLSVYRPSVKSTARMLLDIRDDSDVLLFAANGIRRNQFKDYQTMREAIGRLGASARQRPILFLAVGENLPTERVGQAELRFVPYQTDLAAIARYYHAADIYLHGARVDTFPNSVLEALACGAPVVATAVGGIPEQVKSLEAVQPAAGAPSVRAHDTQEATGFLVPAGDAAAMARAIECLLDTPNLRQRLGENAAADARMRFDLRCEVDRYLAWYEELLAQASALGGRRVHM